MTVVTYSPTASSHDAWQANTGAMTLGSSSLNVDGAARWGGLYVDASADAATLASATISSAYLHLYAESTSYDDVEMDVYGEAADTASVFTTTNYNISSRSRTTAKTYDYGVGIGTARWSINITTVIQEIVEREGWTGPIVLILDGLADAGLRLKAYDGGSDIWSIEITYTAGATTIDASASESLSSSDVATREATFVIYLQDYPRGADSASRQAKIQASATESIAGGETHSARSDLLATVASAMQIIEAMTGSATLRTNVSDSATGSDASQVATVIRVTATDALEVATTLATLATLRANVDEVVELAELVSTPVSGEITVYASADTHEHSSTGVINAAYTSANIATSDDNTRYAARFENVEIPASAQSVAAHLYLYVTTYDDPGLTIAAEASAAPATLSTTDFDISSRDLTDASVNWSAANVGKDAYIATPDLSEIFSELFDLSGWAEGASDVVLILEDNGTGGHLRFGTVESATDPYIVVSFYTGAPLPISVEVSDALSLSTLATRSAIYRAVASDSASVASALATLLALVVSEDVDLSETLRALLSTSVADEALIQSGALVAYGLSLTEPVELLDALTALATLRADATDALSAVDALEIRASYNATESLALADALAVSALLSALAQDSTTIHEYSVGEMLGALDGFASDALRVSDSASGQWHAYAVATGLLSVVDSASALKRILATFVESASISASASALATLRALLQDAAVAGDVATAEFVSAVIDALASETLSASDVTRVHWSITTTDSASLVATLAVVAQFAAYAVDALHASDVAVYLLPSGIVRIEFGINALKIAFDVSAPRVAIDAKAPRVDLSI